MIFLPVTILGAVEQLVTWNPADKAAITLTNGNLDAEPSSSGWQSVRSLISKSTGKWYCEIAIQTVGSGSLVAFCDSGASLTTNFGATAKGRGAQNNGTSYATTYTAGSAQSGFSNGQIVGLAFDMGTGNGFISVNNTWQGSSDPVAQTNPWVTGLSGGVFIGFSGFSAGSKCTLKPYTSSFTYSPPSGYQSFATS